MPALPTSHPDILVLAGGGIVGEAWMHGILAGLEDGAGLDFRGLETYVGTSAGSIVAARLAAGRRPPRPHDRAAPATPPADGSADGTSVLRHAGREAERWGWALTAPVAGAAVAVGAPVGALARAAVLSRAPHSARSLGRLRARVAGWGVRFDGRLRVCTVDRSNGRRVVFGSPGAPAADVADAVCASCAIPWVFSPVEIGSRTYVDGGAWSVTNMDAAPAGRGSRILCLDPVAGGALPGLRGAFRVAAALELQGLRRRGADVLHVTPDAQGTGDLGRNFMDPSRWDPALATGYRQGLALAAGGS
jgi:NTE family protein